MQSLTLLLKSVNLHYIVTLTQQLLTLHLHCKLLTLQTFQVMQSLALYTSPTLRASFQRSNPIVYAALPSITVCDFTNTNVAEIMTGCSSRCEPDLLIGTRPRVGTLNHTIGSRNILMHCFHAQLFVLVAVQWSDKNST